MSVRDDKSMRSSGNVATFSPVENGRFLLAGVLDFDSILSLLPVITAQITKLQDVTIDLAGVNYSNSAGIALLLDVMRQARQQNKNIQFIHFPADMLAIISMCNLEEIFTAP
jgi:phospholipid transport system transporter-binding protein